MLTPVNIYLKLRDAYAGTILLESSDYHGHENSLSFICCKPMASIQVTADAIMCVGPDGIRTSEPTVKDRVLPSLQNFLTSFASQDVQNLKYAPGLFGYMTYDSVRFLEDISLRIEQSSIPDIIYSFYSIMIVVDHFTNELTVIEASYGEGERHLERLIGLLSNSKSSSFPFRLSTDQQESMSDTEFLDLVTEAKKHCFRGDVFQMVLSRRFTQGFRGDEFNVYRALRSINPSPYLFFFDYGGFKLFGSSPEAQLQIRDRKASIFPIAGTFRRSGDDKTDAKLAEQLASDEKENAEHVMLVDLARNDLSRNAEEVEVEVFREVQYYSHVIHLVSKVVGSLRKDVNPLELIAATFPAGTLTGAPKHRAMQCINVYEPINRSFYGGAIGFLGFDGAYNHAIMIRTFLSHQQQLIYQAGAGIVAMSDPATELGEVNNKLAALRKALKMAEQLG